MDIINNIFHEFTHGITITGFVFVMMLVIEYINVQTKGIWQEGISDKRFKQYLFAAILGIIPGCLGAFIAVALFSHRLISLGAIVTTMIATSGDEAFVMFALIPQEALLLTVVIFTIGIIAGYLVDKFSLAKYFTNIFPENSFPLHEEEKCKCFQKDNIWQILQKPSIYRISLTVSILLILLAISFGLIAAKAELWIKSTILFAVMFSLFIVTTVPDHFLKEHLWDHIVKKHLLKIFLWTFGTLLVLSLLTNVVDINSILTENMLLVLLAAVVVGIIPESGPHLVFITLFAQGSIPFSILLASSISQDGHGMLPLLAESKKAFFAVKIINVVVALLVGVILYTIDF